MNGKRFLTSIELEGILSFKAAKLELQPLNVLIGPNGSGKSNLIDALSLLAAAPTDLREFFRKNGGAPEWLWKGAESKEMWIEVYMDLPSVHPEALRYSLTLSVADSGQVSVQEEILAASNEAGALYEAAHGSATALMRLPNRGGGFSRFRPDGEPFDPTQTGLSQRNDSLTYPEIYSLANELKRSLFFREFRGDKLSPARFPQMPDLPDEFLAPDAGNLALVLGRLKSRARTKQRLLEALRLFSGEIEDFDTNLVGGRLQVFLHEKGLLSSTPATRISDGTLRYLCLLAVLCHPDPPPLICIEEPELGLHPDVLPTVAELLIEASQRTQVVVTTHSETLVSALSEVPESIVVCERGFAGTVVRRLEPERLREWLEEYRLGELWRMGEVGGSRW